MTKTKKGNQVTKKPAIVVGTLATGSYWSDAMPFEVIKVTPSGKTITIRRLIATPTKDYDYLSNQEHTFESDPNGEVFTVRFSRAKFGWHTPCNMHVNFGFAREYRDPQF